MKMSYHEPQLAFTLVSYTRYVFFPLTAILARYHSGCFICSEVAISFLTFPCDVPFCWLEQRQTSLTVTPTHTADTKISLSVTRTKKPYIAGTTTATQMPTTTGFPFPPV